MFADIHVVNNLMANLKLEEVTECRVGKKYALTYHFVIFPACTHTRHKYFQKYQELTNLLCKKPGSKYLRFVSHKVSITTIQLCQCSMKAALDNYKWMGMAGFP